MHERMLKKNKTIYNCNNCKKIISRGSNNCDKCSKLKKRKFDVDKETLNKLINLEKIPMTKIGKMFGVSDNAIRKRCQILDIKYK